jgi:hypothetical protein
MKYQFLILSYLCFGGLMSQTFKKDSILYTYPDYISSFSTSSSGKYIGLCVGSQKTVILDSGFKPVKEFEYDILWGGGYPSFSFDEKHVAYVEYGESSKVKIYNLVNGKTESMKVKATELSFFNHSAKLLISWNGHFNLYDLDKGKLKKNIFTVGEKPSWFFASYCLDERDEYLYSSTNRNTIDVFSTTDWSTLKSYGPFGGEIGNLRLMGDLLIFNVKQEVFVCHIKSGQTDRVAVDMEYISDIVIDTLGGKVYIAGNGVKLILLDPRTMKTSEVTPQPDEDCFGLLCLSRNRLLVGNNLKLVLYSR